MSGTNSPSIWDQINGAMNDGTILNAISNPLVSGLASMAKSFGESAMPTRTPTPFLGSLGKATGSAMEGVGQGQALQKSGIQLQQQKMLMDYYKSQYGGGSPMGMPGGGGGGQGSQYGGFNYLTGTSPPELKRMADLYAATGSPNVATQYLKMLEGQGGGPGYAAGVGGFGRVPGSAVDPRQIATTEFTKKSAETAGGNSQGKPEPYNVQTTDPNGKNPGEAGYQPTFEQRYMTPDQARGNAGAGGGRQSAAPVVDPQNAASNALASITDPKARELAVNTLLRSGMPIAAWAPWISTIHTESGWNLNAPNGAAGEIGPGQVKPGTGEMVGIPRDQLGNPANNLLASARYFGQKWQQGGGNPEAAFTGYNSGSVTGKAGSDYVSKGMGRLSGWGYPGASQQAPQQQPAPQQFAGPGAQQGQPPPMQGQPQQQAPLQMRPGFAGQQKTELTPEQTLEQQMRLKAQEQELARHKPTLVPAGESLVLDPAKAASDEAGLAAQNGTPGNPNVLMPTFAGRGTQEKMYETYQGAEKSALAARDQLQEATILKDKLHELGSTGPATPFLANLSRYAEQAGVSPETIAKWKLPPGASETEAAALANGLVMEIAKQKFPGRITNADLNLAKTTKPSPEMPLAAADFLIDNTILPRAQRDVDRFGAIVHLTNKTHPDYDPGLSSMSSRLYQFDEKHPLSSYTPAMQPKKAAAAPIDKAAARAEAIRRGLIKE